MTIGPNFLAVGMSTPSSAKDAASPAQRPGLLRLPNSEPIPPASELSALGGGALFQQLVRSGDVGDELLEVLRRQVLLAGPQQRHETTLGLLLRDAGLLRYAA